MKKALLEVAAAQHSLFTVAQANAAGVNTRTLSYLSGKGEVVRVHRGVYRLAGVPVSWRQEVLAPCLATDGVASHRAAAAVHRLDGVEPVAEVSISRPARRAVPGVIVHQPSVLRRSEVERIDAIPVTKPARTIIDLAAVVDAETLERALDDGLARRLYTVGYVSRRLDALGAKGRAGAAALGRLLQARARQRPTESVFERRLLALIRSAGLPEPVTQHEVRLATGRTYRFDAAYPQWRFAIEAQSYRYHAARSSWARDQTRYAEVAAMGWSVMAVTWDDLEHRPQWVLELIGRRSHG